MVPASPESHTRFQAKRSGSVFRGRKESVLPLPRSALEEFTAENMWCVGAGSFSQRLN